MQFHKIISSLLLATTMVIAMTMPMPILRTDAEEVDLSKLHGVNFISPILGAREFGGGAGNNFPEDYIPRSLGMIKDYGFNVIRVPFYWESYEVDREAFLNQVELIVKLAEANDLYVILDNHQWRTASYFGEGTGFPNYLLIYYGTTGNYEFDVVPFWNDFWNNKWNIWNKQFKFLKEVINRVDKYDNVLGYEILNEPLLTDISHYKKLGKYHTFMVQKLRQVTDKMIFFDREIRLNVKVPSEDLLKYQLLIAPTGVQKMKGIVYSPHIYTVPQLNKESFTIIRQCAEAWKVPVFITEFAAKDTEQTQESTEAFVNVFEKYGFGWTAWVWGARTSDYRLVVFDMDDIIPTSYLEYLVRSVG